MTYTLQLHPQLHVTLTPNTQHPTPDAKTPELNHKYKTQNPSPPNTQPRTQKPDPHKDAGLRASATRTFCF